MRQRAIGLCLVGVALVFYAAVGRAQQMPAPIKREAPIIPGAAEYRPSPERDADPEAQQATTEGRQSRMPALTHDDDNEAQRRRDKERHADEREQHDLQAQRSMAESAKKMLAPAWWQVGIAGAGAVLLVMSLVFSALATKHAARAADAANKTLAAERAWITWEMIGFNVLTNSTFNGVYYNNGIAFNSVWKNTGRSPAVNLRTVNLIEFVHPDYIEAHEFVVRDGCRWTTQSSAGVGMAVSGDMCWMADEHADAFRARKLDVMFYSRVEYADVFYPAVIRTSEVCLRVSYAGGVVLRAGKEIAPLAIRSVGTQNRIT